MSNRLRRVVDRRTRGWDDDQIYRSRILVLQNNPHSSLQKPREALKLALITDLTQP